MVIAFLFRTYPPAVAGAVLSGYLEGGDHQSLFEAVSRQMRRRAGQVR